MIHSYKDYDVRHILVNELRDWFCHAKLAGSVKQESDELYSHPLFVTATDQERHPTVCRWLLQQLELLLKWAAEICPFKYTYIAFTRIVPS